MALIEDPFFENLSRLSDCLCDELAAAGGPDLCYCGLWVGTSAPPLGLGNCESGKPCGVAWVRLVSIVPSSTFPIQDEGGVTACQGPLAYEVEIGVGRCAPSASGRDVFPSEQDLFQAQRLYLSDARAMRRALLCCFPAAAKLAGSPARVALGAYTPLEKSAGKSGGTWQAWIGPA